MSTTITAAADKLAVTEALYRYAAGIDLNDKALLASAFAENAVLDLRPATAKAGFDYPLIEGRENIASALYDSLSLLDTTHSVSNPRVSVDGDTATMEAIVAAMHLPRNDHSRHILNTNRYELELSRHGSVWLIDNLIADNAWTDGDATVLAGI